MEFSIRQAQNIIIGMGSIKLTNCDYDNLYDLYFGGQKGYNPQWGDEYREDEILLYGEFVKLFSSDDKPEKLLRNFRDIIFDQNVQDHSSREQYYKAMNSKDSKIEKLMARDENFKKFYTLNIRFASHMVKMLEHSTTTMLSKDYAVKCNPLPIYECGNLILENSQIEVDTRFCEGRTISENNSLSISEIIGYCESLIRRFVSFYQPREGVDNKV